MRILKRLVVLVLMLAVVGVVSCWVFAPSLVEKQKNLVAEHGAYPVSDAARALHDSMIVGDWHADSLLWRRDLLKRGTRGQVDFPRLVEGGVGMQVFTAVTKSPAGLNYDENSAEAFDNITLLAFGQLWPIRTWNSILERALYQSEKLHRFQSQAPEVLKIIRRRADLEAVISARGAGSKIIAAFLGTEGAHPLEGKLENLDRLYEAGYRLIGLQHFFDNELGGSLHGTKGGGLSDFGRAVVAQVAKRDMVLDVAHSSEKVVRDVLDMVDIPLVLSHTGLHSHCEVKRNLPDELMQRIAAGGGVIGIGYWGEVSCGDDSPAGIATMIKAAIAAVGEDHVSLGSDFDGSVATTFDTSELAALTNALMAAGVRDTQIRKVMGENMLRVWRVRLGKE